MGYIWWLIVVITGLQGFHGNEDSQSCDLLCLNGGKCKMNNGTDTCICTAGFHGLLCEKPFYNCDNISCPECIESGENCTTEGCDIISCHNGGLCMKGISGSHCQLVDTVTLDGHAYVKLPPLSILADKDMLNISLTFSTSVANGVVFFASGDKEVSGKQQYLSLCLINSVMKLSHTLGTETTEAELPIQNTTQGIHTNNVHITISATETNFSIDSDGCNYGKRCHVTVTQMRGNTSFNLNEIFLLGGIDRYTPFIRSKLEITSGFVGCLGTLFVNGKAVNLYQGNSTQVQYGCRKLDNCTQHFCQNNGRCVDLWNRKYCMCKPGFYGDQCEYQNEAHFVDGSFLHFDDSEEVLELSMWITSTVDTGIIAYTTGFDSMAIMLDKGKVRLHILATGSDEIISLVGRNLSDGNWFFIRLFFSSTKYTLQVLSNRTGDSGGFTSGTIGGFLTIYMPLYFGELHNHKEFQKWRRTNPSLPTEKSFVGCMKNVYINGYKKDLSTTSATRYGNDTAIPFPGCPRDDDCWSSPCQNGGMCVGGWQGPKCQCQTGFKGDDCSDVEASTFNGKSSYVTVELDRNQFPFGDRGIFEFRTRQKSATLMLIQLHSLTNSILISLEFRLQNERLEMIVNNTSLTTFPINVSDGSWHLVEWHQAEGGLQVDLNGVLLEHPHVIDFFTADQQSEIIIHIGAQPFDRDNIYMMSYFHGCLRNIQFNNKLLNILDVYSVVEGTVISSQYVEIGCHGDDICRTNVCQKNSFCNDIWNGYTCPCLDGWDGIFCNQSIDDCVNNFCTSDSTCVDGHMTYSCLCPPGKTGRLCEHFVFACDSRPCATVNTEACIDVFPLDYKCHCKPGWLGKNCTEEINECLSSPCQNYGTCIDLVRSYKCNCLSDFTGVICEEKLLCFKESCFNGGTCHPNEENSSYSCSCLPQYSGTQCQTFDTCFYNPCQNNGTCHVQTNVSQGYLCDCKDGFYGEYCQYTDACTSHPCQNNGQCQNDGVSFTCICNQYYLGDLCQIPINLCDSNQCSNNGLCINSTTGFKCVCNQSFTGALCETEINLCEMCVHGHCGKTSSQNTGISCNCISGFYGDLCQHDINECHDNPCAHNGTCINQIGDYTCKCMEHFQGQNCELDLQGCLSSPCLNGASCEVNFDKTYSCVCLSGFTGQFCEIDIDNCINHSCQNNATCIDGIDEYSCQCLSGYGDRFCDSVINICFSQPCLNHGTCIFCEVCSDKDSPEPCLSQNQTCQYGSCLSQSGCHGNKSSYICDCTSTGYQGSHCLEDMNECDTLNICKNNGLCINTVGSYFCDCNHTGYQGQHCDLDINECQRDLCYNGGKCVNIPGSFKCQCKSGWSGQTCGENIDDCTALSCLNGGQCIDVINGFICNCTDTGYHGDDCSVYTNHCDSFTCKNGGKCYNDGSLYMCDCSETGFKGSNCDVEVDECLSSPCRHNGSCVNGINRFDCDCKATGHAGEMCEEDIDECHLGIHGCHNEATCLNNYGSYYCSCAMPYTGVYCESLMPLVDELSHHVQLKVIIPSVVMVILLVTTVLFLFRYIRLKRKMHGQYKPSQEEAVISLGIPLEKMLDVTTGERLI